MNQSFFIDERTYRRWRKKELKNGLQSKYYEIFRKMPETERLFNEYYLKNISASIFNQSEYMFLRTCYDLRGTRLHRIIDFILPILKTKDDLPTKEYLTELKRAIWEYEEYQEFLGEQEIGEYLSLPKYSFNRGESSLLVLYKIVKGKTAKNYILGNKKQPNIMAEILNRNHFQVALKNQK